MRSKARALRLYTRAVEASRSPNQVRSSVPAFTALFQHSLLRSLWSGSCSCIHHSYHHIDPARARHPPLARPFSSLPSVAPTPVLPPAVRQLQPRISHFLYSLQQSQLPTPLPVTTAALLSSARHTLTQPFLLVVVGEYNSSKSSLINALIGQPLLAVGPLPTTEHIYVIQHSQHASSGTTIAGAPNSSISSSAPIRPLTADSPLLQSVSIVDTPGTNALSREHEQLTTSFLPRADLLLLVTSADRPFSESERAFLQQTQQYRKKVVLVLSKADLLPSDDDKRAVVEYVRRGAEEVLGEKQTVLVASTKEGSEGVRSVEEFITRSLTATDRLHLKLSSPLLVARRVLSEREEELRLLDLLITRKAGVLEQVERLSAEYAAGMEAELGRQWTRVHNVFARLQQRSVEWVAEKGQLIRVTEWLRDDMAVKYEREVQQWTDVQSEVQAALLALLDGLSERSERYVQEVRRIVVEGEEDMAAERQHRLLQSMQGAVGDILSAEMSESARSPLSSAAISASLSSSLFTSAALHTGALSLAVSSLLSLSFLDFTGLLSSLLVVGGLGWLPWRRSQLVENVKSKVVEMEARVQGVVRREVEVERERIERRVARWMVEVRRGVEKERETLTAAKTEVGTMQAECEQLLREVNAWKETSMDRNSSLSTTSK